MVIKGPLYGRRSEDRRVVVLCLVRLLLRSHLGAWGASGRQGTRAYCRYRICCLGALSSLLIDHHFRKNNFNIFALIAAIGLNLSLYLSSAYLPIKRQIEPQRCFDPRINLPRPPLRLWHPDGQNTRHRQVCSNHCHQFYLASRVFGVVENLLVLLRRPLACSKCLRRLHT